MKPLLHISVTVSLALEVNGDNLRKLCLLQQPKIELYVTDGIAYLSC